MSRSYQPCLRAIRNLGERALPVGASIVSRANVNLNILFIELPGEHGSRRHRRLRARGRLFVKRRDLRFGPKAPFWQSVADFRSTLMNGHIQSPPARLKGAINRHDVLDHCALEMKGAAN
jgi:hypothetical protein